MDYMKLSKKYGSLVEAYKFFMKLTGVPIASALLTLTAAVNDTGNNLLDIPGMIADEYSIHKED